MGFRTIIIKSKYKLEYSMNHLIARNENEYKEINLDEINSLIIQSTQVAITSSLLANLAEKNINVVICDEKANPTSELINYNGIYDSRDKLIKQFSIGREEIAIVWKEIIKEKIKNQRRIITKYKRDDKIISLFNGYIDGTCDDDITNREGHAAKVYFNTMFGKDFARSNPCDENIFLDYGYTILLSCFNRSIRSIGYYPELGIHHIGKTNPFNLSCDLMEPLRPLVDSYIFNKTVNIKNFKKEYVDMLNLMVKYDGDSMYLENAIRLYCKMIMSALTTKQIEKVKFIEYGI